MANLAETLSRPLQVASFLRIGMIECVGKVSTKLAIIVHGLFTKDVTDSPLDSLTPLLKSLGFDVHHFRYGFSGINKTLENKKTSEGLTWILNSISTTSYTQVLLIGHSNGCAIIDIAVRRSDSHLRPFIIFLSPLVRRKTSLSKYVDRLDICYNPRDIVSYITRPLALLPDFLVRSNWGDMATKGSAGYYSNVFNHKSLCSSFNPWVQHNPFLLDKHDTYYLVCHLKYLFSV